MKKINPKIVLVVLGLVFTSSVAWGQVKDKKKKEKPDTSKMAPSSKTMTEGLGNSSKAPLVILGILNSNNATNSLDIDIADEKFSVEGVIARIDGWKGATAAVNLSGKNESKSVNIFSGDKISPKFKGDLYLTLPTNPIIVFNKKKDVKLKEALDNLTGNKYNFLEDNALNFKGIELYKQFFFTVGLTLEGAKYNLIDTSDNAESLVNSRNFAGASLYGQGNWMRYHYQKKRTIFHSIRTSFGQVNNVSSLTEHAITTSATYTEPNTSTKVERKRTGFYDKYLAQNRLTIGYEFSSYNLDTTDRRIGYLTAFQYMVNTETDNFVTLDFGLTFPAKLSNKHIFLAAILRTTDPLDMTNQKEFEFANTLSFSLKVSTNLRINYKEK